MENMRTKEETLKRIRGKIIVSCQGDPEVNPMGTPENLLLMADCAARGGAAGFRANRPENIRLIKEAFPDLPMIGIWKIVTGDNPVYITPNMEAVDTLVDLGCEIVAIDGTDRINAAGKKAWQLLSEAKEKHPNTLIMADLADIHDARMAVAAGADICSTTLSGYTDYTEDKKGSCDFELVRQIRQEFPNMFIITEGKIWSREDAMKAFDCGADAVVVGTAITNPLSITERYVRSIDEHLSIP